MVLSFLYHLVRRTNIPLLGNLGPKIPIRFHVIGNVHSDVTASIEEFGINSAYVEVGIHMEVNVQIIVPFASKSSTVSQNIPVAMGLTRYQFQIFIRIARMRLSLPSKYLFLISRNVCCDSCWSSFNMLH